MQRQLYCAGRVERVASGALPALLQLAGRAAGADRGGGQPEPRAAGKPPICRQDLAALTLLLTTNSTCSV